MVIIKIVNEVILLAQVLRDIQRLHPRIRLTEREKKFLQYYTKRYIFVKTRGENHIFPDIHPKTMTICFRYIGTYDATLDRYTRPAVAIDQWNLFKSVLTSSPLTNNGSS